IGPAADIPELDLPSAEALVERLASPDPAMVVAAMDVLVAHQRVKLVPALLLRHDSEPVLVHALGIFWDEKARTDWLPLAQKLVDHPSEVVRIAALRALAKRGRFDAVEKASADTSARVRAYAAFQLALRDAPADLAKHPLIDAILKMPGQLGRDSRHEL